KGLLNSDIAGAIKNQDNALVIADSAEPKSIDEIISYGVSVIPSTKAQGSILQGIQAVQNQRISVNKRSVYTIKEYRNYLWETDKEGKIINEPSPILNHAMDAIRYGVVSLSPNEDDNEILPDDTLEFKNGFY